MFKSILKKSILSLLALTMFVSALPLQLLTVGKDAVLSHAAFGYYRAITVDHTKVPNTDQTDFPVGVIGTYTELKVTGSGGHVQNASGYDIGFYTNSDCSTGKMKWEKVKWVSTTGAVEYWVKVSSLSHTTDTTFYMCYGDSGISTDQSDRTNTWNTAIKGVFHFGDGSSLVVNDSSSYSISGTNNGVTATTGAFGGGSLGGAGSFSGSNDISYGNNFGETGDMTLSAWIYSSPYSNTVWFDKTNPGTGKASPIGTNYSGAYNQARLIIGNTSADSDQTIRTISTPPTNTWYKVSYIISGTNYKIRTNGSTETSGTYSATRTDGGGTMHMGVNGPGTEHFTGYLDEVRLSNTAVSDDWDTTTYNNESSPSTFYTAGTETAVSGGGGITAKQKGSFFMCF